ncbi:MAG: VacJ family lipoprotein, partial [Gammaproteobacteria bacterium]
MFSFNRGVDRWFLKPVAKGYNLVLPDVVQIGVRNVISNIDVFRRLINNLLQLKFEGAGREILRFTINSTLGVAGLVDLAKLGPGIPESDEDTGQTMGVYGVKPGPYLVLPFFSPMTVRDGIGTVFDRAMNPLLYVGIFVDGATGVGAGTFTLNAIDERSLNLETFEQVEESVIDLYSAVRNAYLQNREAAIRE